MKMVKAVPYGLLFFICQNIQLTSWVEVKLTAHDSSIFHIESINADSSPSSVHADLHTTSGRGKPTI